MKTILVSALALGVMTSAAFAGPVKVTPAQAGPVKLTAAQMDSVTAGQFTFVQANVALQAAWAGCGGGDANAVNVALQGNFAGSFNDNEDD